MKPIIKLIAVLLLILSSLVFGAGQLSDAYLNRMIANYRFYEGFTLSPSMTTEIDQMEIGANIVNLSKLELNHYHYYVYFPLYLRWTLGVSYYSPGGVITQPVINEYGETQPQTFQVGERIISANVAYRFPLFSVGMNVNADIRKDVTYVDLNDLSKGIKKITNTLAGVDLGVTFYPFEKYSIGDLELGVTAQNLTGPVFKLKETEETGKPNIVFNYRYAGIKRNLILSGDVSYGSLKELGMSFDAFYMLPQFFGFGLGYIKDYYDPNFVYLATELRLQYLVNRLSRIKFEVGSGISDIKDLNFVYKLGFAAKVYKTREELYAERLYNLAKVAPNKAFFEAMKLYKERKYWQAAIKFGYVVSKYPRFYKVDAATYYLGSCYQKLQMDDIAMDIYKQGLNKYKTSDFYALFNYKLEELYYKKGDISQALNYYNEVEKTYAYQKQEGQLSEVETIIDRDQREAINGARYIAASMAYDQGDYETCLSNISKIDKTSSFYYFGKYTEALAYLGQGLQNVPQLNDKFMAAVKSLDEILYNVKIDPKNPDDIAKFELKNKALILKGHIYQELGKINHDVSLFKKSLEAYASVAKTSMYYDEALLGLVWVLLRSDKIPDALKFAKELVSLETIYKPEAYLILGYAQYLNQQYQEAIESFTKAEELANEYLQKVDNSSNVVSEYNDKVRKINEFGKKSLSVVLSKTEKGKEEKVASLEAQYKELLSQLSDADIKLQVLNKMKTFGVKSYEFVKTNAALAKGNAQARLGELREEELKRKQSKKLEETEKKIQEKQKEEEELKKLLEEGGLE